MNLLWWFVFPDCRPSLEAPSVWSIRSTIVSSSAQTASPQIVGPHCRPRRFAVADEYEDHELLLLQILHQKALLLGFTKPEHRSSRYLPKIDWGNSKQYSCQVNKKSGPGFAWKTGHKKKLGSQSHDLEIQKMLTAGLSDVLYTQIGQTFVRKSPYGFRAVPRNPISPPQHQQPLSKQWKGYECSHISWASSEDVRVTWTMLMHPFYRLAERARQWRSDCWAHQVHSKICWSRSVVWQFSVVKLCMHSSSYFLMWFVLGFQLSQNTH